MPGSGFVAILPWSRREGETRDAEHRSDWRGPDRQHPCAQHRRARRRAPGRRGRRRHRAAERLAEPCGAPALSLDAAFAADAVLIGSPTPTHADYIERAAAAGRAIFCEKPIDLSAPRVRICLDAARRAGVVLMVGFNRRFDPHFATLKRRLDAGEIGALELLTIISRDPAPPPPAYVATSGGLFRDMMIHDFDMARFLLGEEPVEVHAAASCLVDPRSRQPGMSIQPW